MPDSPAPRIAIADCATLGHLPEICRLAATRLHEAGVKVSDILFFEVCATPRTPNGKLAPSDAPDRLICVTLGTPAREFIARAVLEVKMHLPPGRDPGLQISASLTLKDVFREMTAADNTAICLKPKNEHPVSVFFLDGAFTVSEVGKELSRPWS